MIRILETMNWNKWLAAACEAATFWVLFAVSSVQRRGTRVELAYGLTERLGIMTFLDLRSSSKKLDFDELRLVVVT
jgi:hypothetical protein